MSAPLVFLFVATLLPGATAATVHDAPCAAFVEPAAKAITCRGLLWKVEARAGTRPSYLFGTIHLDDPRVTRLPPPVRAAFDGADSLTTEMFANGPGLVHMAETMYFNDGRTLDALLGPQWFARLRDAVAENHLPVTGLERKKPWAVFFLLSAPRPRVGLPLDLMLQTEAVFAGKRSYALETMAEQLAVFDGLPLEDQVEILKSMLAERRRESADIEPLVRAYLARDLAALMHHVQARSVGDDRLQQALLQRLLLARNRLMAERVIPRLNEGNAFIAVGAGHLPGRDGLLMLLHQRGYRVTPVY